MCFIPYSGSMWKGDTAFEKHKPTEEVKFMCNHIDRKSNEVIFRKCVNPRCKHCQGSPVISKMRGNISRKTISSGQILNRVKSILVIT